jgi:uncharacterized protein (TIGR02271 family)
VTPRRSLNQIPINPSMKNYLVPGNVSTTAVVTDTPAVVALLQETLEISKTQKEIGAVRVRVVVDESVSDEVVDLTTEEVVSTRVPRGIEVQTRREPWNEGETIVVPVYEEVIVTERRLILKEEVHITRHIHRSREPVSVPLRQERAVIERRLPDGSWDAVGEADTAGSTGPSIAFD